MLQAASNGQLNTHVYSAYLLLLMLTYMETKHYGRGNGSAARLVALHETAAEKLGFHFGTCDVAACLVLPDYDDMFSSNLAIHHINSEEEQLVMGDVLRYHVRTSVALRCPKYASVSMKKDKHLDTFLA